MDDGHQIVQQHGTLPDPFWQLVCDARSSQTSARVKMNVGNTVATERLNAQGLNEDVWPRCECTVEIECPQSKQMIDYAAELAFKTALGFVNDGMSHLVPGYAPIPYDR